VPRSEPPAERRCDFCGKYESADLSIVAGPGVYICNECVDLCIEVLAQRGVHVRHWHGPPEQQAR